jgi:hypothetical protein
MCIVHSFPIILIIALRGLDLSSRVCLRRPHGSKATTSCDAEAWDLEHVTECLDGEKSETFHCITWDRLSKF